jgi:hypothetical protein
MVFMLPYSTGVYKYIVQINMDESSDLLSEEGGHEPLERQGGIAVPLLHDLTNERSQDSHQGRLGDVRWPDAYLFIRLRHIELISICATGNIMPDVVLIREGCYVLHRIIVLFAQVKHCAKLPIFLGNAKHRYSLSGCSWDSPPGGGVSQNFL